MCAHYYLRDHPLSFMAHPWNDLLSHVRRYHFSGVFSCLDFYPHKVIFPPSVTDFFLFLQNALIPDRRATSSSSHHHHSDHQNLAFQSKQVSFPTTRTENTFSSNQYRHQPHSHLPQQSISDLGRPEFSSAF